MKPRSDSTSQRPSRLPLLGLLVLFLTPLLAAVVIYSQPGRWLERSGSGHHGQLFQPARRLGVFPVRDRQGKRLGVEYLQGQWTLLYMGPGECPPSCRRALYKIRQAHKAQGRNIGRVQRLFVALGKTPGQKAQAFFEKDHPHLTVATPISGAFDRSLFRMANGADGTDREGIYIVDPNANLVLRYGVATDAGGILKDLEHLLKYSAIG